MSNPLIPMDVTMAPPPPGFSGDEAALFRLIAQNLTVTFPVSASIFESGSVLPTSNVGPFWFTGVDPPQWYGWSTTTASYVPTVNIRNIINSIWVVGDTKFFYGSAAAITASQNPLGWYLMDGLVHNGILTPNAIDRMFIGSGNLYANGSTGGSATIPNHNHTLPANTGDTMLTVDQIPSHSHTATPVYTDNSQAGGGVRQCYSPTNFGTPGITIGTTGGGLAHTHTIGGNTGDAGGGSVLNPYLALWPLMFCGIP